MATKLFYYSIAQRSDADYLSQKFIIIWAETVFRLACAIINTDEVGSVGRSRLCIAESIQ